MAHKNSEFLTAIDPESKRAILDSIAYHYEVSSERIEAEVLNSDAEDILEYLVEPMRSAAYVLKQRHGLGQIGL